ncbi:MAG TPA: OmpH family outer membrane protein [Bacillota bacterium]|jgi:outer membrane protein|nr:OmpH family outer membrane protein [Bacteroidaceae bacterium]NLA94162.1 OmpH family outer membrane protein [Bacteroidales bacterium]HQO43806.1 OmpH family outer membrane protein [Bacillota bacterium]MBP8602475.1 OmpH family outer membrane protein [Bacteroidaceae bacterium]HOD68036.1 OmpH family outer membrane protein [Bacteroidaceae bacterium]
MKLFRKTLFLLLMSVTVAVSAQTGNFGYMDFNGAIKLMPEYFEAQLNLQKIQSDYKNEIDRSKREFERQYVEFMLEQDHLAPTIVAKRQKELQVLMDAYAEFRDSVQVDLESIRLEMLNPIKEKLLKAIYKAGMDLNLDYVIDTGTGAYLYINNDKGIDISNYVYKILGLQEDVSEGDFESLMIPINEAVKTEEEEDEEANEEVNIEE